MERAKIAKRETNMTSARPTIYIYAFPALSREICNIEA